MLGKFVSFPDTGIAAATPRWGDLEPEEKLAIERASLFCNPVFLYCEELDRWVAINFREDPPQDSNKYIRSTHERTYHKMG